MQHLSTGVGLRPEHREILYLCTLLQQARRAVSIANIQELLTEALASGSQGWHLTPEQVPVLLLQEVT